MKPLSAIVLTVVMAMVSIPANVAATEPALNPHPPGRLISVNGTSLWIETEGRGKPLVVLPGGPAASHAVMHPTFSSLANSHMIIYYDYRGRGRSKSTASATFAQDVEDLEALRASLGLKQISIYGFSYGGLVAQAYALAHPEQVSHLVLANTLYSAEMWKLNHANINAEMRNQYPEVWEQIEALRAHGAHSSSPEMQKLFSLHGGITRWFNPDNAKLIRKEPGSFNRSLYWQFVGEDIDFSNGGEVTALPDFRPRLKEFQMPVMILAGRFDRALFPRMQFDFKHYCPQATFVMLERSGSFGHIEEPETVKRLVREFLGERPSHESKAVNDLPSRSPAPKP